MKQKNYNRLALQGMEVNDMEFVKEYNLNPNVAYSNKINDAMLDLMYQENIKGYMMQGETEASAKSKAGRHRAEGKKEINNLLKLHKMM